MFEVPPVSSAAPGTRRYKTRRYKTRREKIRCWVHPWRRSFDSRLAVVSDHDAVEIPSGKHTKSNGKWPFIVDFPIKNGDFP